MTNTLLNNRIILLSYGIGNDNVQSYVLNNHTVTRRNGIGHTKS